MNAFRDFIAPLKSPGAEYGEVPFYWWSGEPLNKKRLREQLETLAAHGAAGVQINYAHQHGGGEKDEPYGGAGRSIPGEPYQFSEDWWDFFGYAARVCEELGMGVGVGDYTLAWLGNGFFTDAVAAEPGMRAETLSAERKNLFGMEDVPEPESVLAVVCYEDETYSVPRVLYERGRSLPFPTGWYDAFILRTAPAPRSLDPLHPDCGRLLTQLYFGEFERRLPDLKPGTLNYFFQDELLFGVDVKTVWRENLREGVREKYGYDPLGFLPHLFYNLGALTPKIRLDIADVRTELIERNYFRPVYEFHASRGMIYGCDQSGRGRRPDEFSDYFRTVRWFTAPGNDTPGRAADLIKVKVNASIAELYDQPRVWLEAYHSSGWGTSPESVTKATSENFLFGANLLNLHGLYYTTNGGFFEWAPPDFHFRMPYWDDLSAWLSKYKSLAAMLTTGRHVCDAAVFYPVSVFDYGENAELCLDRTFRTAEYIFSHGLDFTFIDHQSIERAEAANGCLTLPGASFRAVIVCAADCVRFSVLEKLRAFAEQGGAVVFTDFTPSRTDLAPEALGKLRDTVEAILDCPSSGICGSPEAVLQFLHAHATRTFLPDRVDDARTVYCTARVSEGQTLFFTRGCSKDSVCRFAVKGRPFLLDPYRKTVTRLTGTVQVGNFHFVKMPLEAEADTLLLFSDDYVPFDAELSTEGLETTSPDRVYPVEGEWRFSLVPTLDNRWGDFYKPAGGVIGPEARFFRVCPEGCETAAAELPYCRSRSIAVLRAPEDVFETCRRYSRTDAVPEFYEFADLHDRYGYIAPTPNSEAARYEQGFHGLKGKVYDYNFCFEADCVFLTNVLCAEETHARFVLTGVAPDALFLNGRQIEDLSAPIVLPRGLSRLSAGFVYDAAARPDYVNRAALKRAGVWLFKDGASPVRRYPLAMTAFANPDALPFTPIGGAAGTYVLEFTAMPGFTGFAGEFFGDLLEARCGGEQMAVRETGKGYFGGRRYEAACTLVEHAPFGRLLVRPENGKSDGGLLPAPLTLRCGEGKASCGDLAETGALRCYSGKAVYRKTVTLNRYPDERFYLELGDVGVTARVKLNGEEAGVLTYAPYTLEITDLVRNGDNELEITVSNTLCNHYSTIPSGYSNFPADAKSGLIGPVSISVYTE